MKKASVLFLTGILMLNFLLLNFSKTASAEETEAFVIDTIKTTESPMPSALENKSAESLDTARAVWVSETIDINEKAYGQ